MTIQYGSRDISKVGNTVYFKFRGTGTKDFGISFPFKDMFSGICESDCKAMGGVAETWFSGRCPDGTGLVKRCVVANGAGFFRSLGISDCSRLHLDREKSSLKWTLVDRSGRGCSPGEPTTAYNNFSANIDKSGQINVGCGGLRWTQNCTSSLSSSWYTNNIVSPFKAKISAIQNELLNVIDTLQDPDVDINTANDLVVAGIKTYNEASNLRLQFASMASEYGLSGDGGKCYEMQHTIQGTIAFTIGHSTSAKSSAYMGRSTKYSCLDAESQGLMDSALRIIDTNYAKVKDTYNKIYAVEVSQVFKTKFGIDTNIKRFEASDLMCPVEYILKDLQCVKELVPEPPLVEDNEEGEVRVDDESYDPISPDIITGKVVEEVPSSKLSGGLILGGLALVGVAGYYFIKKKR